MGTHYIFSQFLCMFENLHNGHFVVVIVRIQIYLYLRQLFNDW